MPKNKVPGLFILVGDCPVACHDILEWLDWMEKHAENIVVGKDSLPTCEVHTCFLGMDLAACLKNTIPLVFETAVFGGADSMEILQLERCTTLSEARQMHDRVVEKFSKISNA